MNITDTKKDVIFFIALILFVSSYVVDLPAGIGIAYIGLLLVILTITYAYYNSHKIPLRLTALEVFVSLFVIFCLLSTLWAVNRTYAMSRCIGLIEMLAILFVLSIVFYEDVDVDSLLRVIMVGYYFVVGYVLIRFGIGDSLSLLLSGERIPNFILNSNVLGACSAYSLLLTLYYFTKRERNSWIFLSVFSIIGLVVSGSRKAIVIIVIGAILYFTLINLGAKKGMAIIKIFASILSLIIVIYFLSRLSVFSGVNDRIVEMINGLIGQGVTDSSTITRMRLKQVGFDLFRTHWLKGVGIDNPGIFGGLAFQREYYYLHDNYVELLAGVGIIGFVLYYLPFLIIAIRYIRYRDFNDKEYDICVALLFVWLIMDYGIVTYSFIGTYFFLLAFWMESEKMKRIYNQSIKRTIKHES